MEQAFDPLNYDNLARSVVAALLEQSAGPLPPACAFLGSGVYAIYYNGKLPYYVHLSSPECRMPIYVGKATPDGGRKGSAERRAEGRELCRRLAEHAKSVEDAQNLQLSEFRCRYLVVVPVWVTLAERFLIDHFQPVWNTVVDGFGNHDPGSGRRAMRRPRWDILHPGRSWADRLAPAETAEQVIRLIPPPA